MTRINWNLRIYDDNPCYITLLLNIKQNSAWANQVPWTLSLSLPLKIHPPHHPTPPLPKSPGEFQPSEHEQTSYTPCLTLAITLSLLRTPNFSVCFTSMCTGHKTLVWPIQTRHQIFDEGQLQGLAQIMVIELQGLEKWNRRLENFKWFWNMNSCCHWRSPQHVRCLASHRLHCGGTPVSFLLPSYKGNLGQRDCLMISFIMSSGPA